MKKLYLLLLAMLLSGCSLLFQHISSDGRIYSSR